MHNEVVIRSSSRTHDNVKSLHRAVQSLAVCNRPTEAQKTAAAAILDGPSTSTSTGPSLGIQSSAKDQYKDIDNFLAIAAPEQLAVLDKLNPSSETQLEPGHAQVNFAGTNFVVNMKGKFSVPFLSFFARCYPCFLVVYNL